MTGARPHPNPMPTDHGWAWSAPGAAGIAETLAEARSLIAAAAPAPEPEDARAMTYAATTTLNRIRAALPCEYGWRKLLAALDKTKADDEPLHLLTVLDSNGLDDALWVLSYAMPDDRLARHYQAWCAEQVVHLFEAERPGDSRVRDQIVMLRRDDATAEERAAAWAAAQAAAGGAAGDAAWADAWAAAQAAAQAAARAAARAAAGGTAGGAAWVATWAAARAAQEKQLRTMAADSFAGVSHDQP